MLLKIRYGILNERRKLDNYELSIELITSYESPGPTNGGKYVHDDNASYFGNEQH